MKNLRAAVKDLKGQIYDLFIGKKNIENYSGCWCFSEIVNLLQFPKILDNRRGYKFAEKEIESYK